MFDFSLSRVFFLMTNDFLWKLISDDGFWKCWTALVKFYIFFKIILNHPETVFPSRIRLQSYAEQFVIQHDRKFNDRLFFRNHIEDPFIAPLYVIIFVEGSWWIRFKRVKCMKTTHALHFSLLLLLPQRLLLVYETIQ